MKPKAVTRDEPPTPAPATWTPICCRTCGAGVQWMRTGRDADSRLWCGHCRRVLTVPETTARGSVALNAEPTP